MKYKTDYFFCSPKLLQNVEEIQEIFSCVDNVKWREEFRIEAGGKEYLHQSAYNKAFEIEFKKYDWATQPIISKEVGLKGDFRKNDVLIEIQFGNSSTLYRDYYKFHYGLTKNLLTLAVLVVPTNPQRFFPTRPKSVSMNRPDFPGGSII